MRLLNPDNVPYNIIVLDKLTKRGRNCPRKNINIFIIFITDIINLFITDTVNLPIIPKRKPRRPRKVIIATINVDLFTISTLE